MQLKEENARLKMQVQRRVSLGEAFAAPGIGSRDLGASVFVA